MPLLEGPIILQNGGAAKPPLQFMLQLALLGGAYVWRIFLFKKPSKNQQNEIVHAELQQLVYLPLLTIQSTVFEHFDWSASVDTGLVTLQHPSKKSCQNLTGVFKKKAPCPWEFSISLYIFVHLLHMFLYMLFVFFMVFVCIFDIRQIPNKRGAPPIYYLSILYQKCTQKL